MLQGLEQRAFNSRLEPMVDAPTVEANGEDALPGLENHVAIFCTFYHVLSKILLNYMCSMYFYVFS